MYTHEIPLDRYYGDAVIWDIPKKKWELIMPADLEKANKKLPIKPDDIVIVHTGWNKYWGDNTQYFCYSPGMGKAAGEWLVAHKIKALGVDQQALDHPLHTAIGPHGPGGPLRKDVCDEYKRETGHEAIEDFPEWEPCHNAIMRAGILGWENVGGDIAKVVGKRCKIAGFPIRWYMGDGSIVRIVAIIDEKDLNDVPTRIYKYGTT
jgi:kynurenine formamidase